MMSDTCRGQRHKLCAVVGKPCSCSCHAADEKAWNEAHGLTATCSQCGGAMRDDGRTLCSWACWHQATKTDTP